MAVRVAINGFGRIGRLALRRALSDPAIEFVAVNDLTDPGTLSFLFCHDSVHGCLPGNDRVETTENGIKIGDREIRVLSERDPEKLPWKELGVDAVLECTGLFRSREGASKHLEAGAGHVIISAPGKDPDITVVMGVNHQELDRERDKIISNASCEHITS